MAPTADSSTKKDNNDDNMKSFQLLQKTRLSPDSFLLRYKLPSPPGRPNIPTCLKLNYPHGTSKKGIPKVLSKSYSPVSHPNTVGHFDLVVKEYPVQPGGGVAAYLCQQSVGDVVTGTWKKERLVHGKSEILGRWKHVGLIGGGTGIAPLLQLATILLSEEEGEETSISILSINRKEEDILCRDQMDQWSKDYPDRVRVSYSLTGEEQADAANFYSGRGSVEMARATLPPSTKDGSTMLFVCGRDGFVETWGGPVLKTKKRKPDGSKVPKQQGPLLGILLKAGYEASEVFKY